jgi:hypothetical protein
MTTPTNPSVRLGILAVVVAATTIGIATPVNATNIGLRISVGAHLLSMGERLPRLSEYGNNAMRPPSSLAPPHAQWGYGRRYHHQR